MKSHRTKDGQIMFIAEMDDSHLKNAINLILRNSAYAKMVLAGTNEDKSADQKVKEAITGVKFHMDEDQAKEYLQNTYEVLLPDYIFEAAIRGLEVPEEIKKIRDIFVRSEKAFNRSTDVLNLIEGQAEED